MLSLPTLPEYHHQIVESLSQYSDRELVNLHQLHPEQGKFFTAFFCRYEAIVYSIVQHAAESPIQINYLFASAWRQIFQELNRVQLSADPDATNWQNWSIDITGQTIDRLKIPAPEQIHYSITDAPPPFWCYLERGLDLIPPLSRLIVVMTQNLKWNENRISAYLKGEGETISPESIPTYLATGYQQLEAALPQDIRDIYLPISSHN
jgi:hypothetical protein